MSDALKFELAKELGFYDTLATSGFGDVSSRNCGNMVRLAIERAQRDLAASQNSPLV